METKLIVDPDRTVGTVDPLLFGHFVEHFHREVYGGIFEPESTLSDSHGMRVDVAEAIRAISPPVVRWPGGCFASAYHWQDGVGPERTPAFDKAWRVEDPNSFGTDEFVRFCASIGAEPYICTNAGTGTIEEMSSWVEYCNLESAGQWTRRRREYGSAEPHRVKYWSIGNENYGSWEIGAKSAAEWGPFVREAAKAMKAVDPSIELFAASTMDVDWNLALLREAGEYLDWLSVHAYWDPLWERNDLAPYERCMAHTLSIPRTMEWAEHILGALGYLGKIKIAVDEWNLRGWHHPHRMSATEDYLSPRDLNDLNSSYTMADAVFTACFLNESLRRCRTVRMTNFSPLVNGRGLIYAHNGGIVLRTTYHAFALYAGRMRGEVVDTWMRDNGDFSVASEKGGLAVPTIDAVSVLDRDEGRLCTAIVNRHPKDAVTVSVAAGRGDYLPQGIWTRLESPSTDSFNDSDAPDVVSPKISEVTRGAGGTWDLVLQPHSVNLLELSAQTDRASRRSPQ